jgi:phage terminase, large subunit, PBSX family
VSDELVIPTQRKVLPLLEPSRYKGIYGGRGKGASHFFGELMIEEHIANPDQRSVCLREVQRTLAQSVKQVLEDKIRKFHVESHFDIRDNGIRSKRGTGLIIFEGMQNYNADNIKSLEGFDRAWFAEAHRASQRSLDLLRPTIREPGSELWFDWNPNEPTDPVDVFLRGPNVPTDAVVVEMSYLDNPWFPEVLYKEMEYDKRTDPDKYAWIWLGKYNTTGDKRVFKNWHIEDFAAPRDAAFWLGVDWGFSGDPTAMVRCFMVGRKLYVDYEAYEVGCELEDTPSLFMTIPESERWPSSADDSRPETISYVKRHGFPKLQRAVKGSIEDSVEFLRSYEIIVHPRCRHTIDELTLYAYKVDALTGRVLPVIEDKHNHCIDALRYALECTRRALATVKHVKTRLRPILSRWR